MYSHQAAETVMHARQPRAGGAPLAAVAGATWIAPQTTLSSRVAP